MQIRVHSNATIIEVHGTARSRGAAHGETARALIHENLDRIREGILTAKGRFDDGSYNRILAENERFVAESVPELLEEIRGIADASNARYEDILQLNLPLYMVRNFMALDCTQVLLGPTRTSTGAPFLAKTRDNVCASQLLHVVTDSTYPNETRVVEVNVAGSITWPGSGINSSGVTVATSGSWPRAFPYDVEHGNMGWLLVNVHSLIAESRSVDDVHRLLQGQRRVTGMNVMAADSAGRSGAFEVTPQLVVRSTEMDGVLIRTNHFMSLDLRHLGPTAEEHPSSHNRSRVAAERLANGNRRWELSEVFALLCDHEGYPDSSICRHSKSGAGSDTQYASVADLSSGDFYVYMGHPCSALPTRISPHNNA